MVGRARSAALRSTKKTTSRTGPPPTYYAVLAIFPALIVLVALVGIFGQYPKTTNALLDIVRDIGPESAVDTFRKPITGVVRDKGGAGALLGIGLVAAIWAASGYVGAFMRASNQIYEVEEGRPFWKLRPLQVAVTLMMVLGATLVALGIVVTGPLASAVGDVVGLGDTAVTVWNIAKWPVMGLIVVTMFAVLYYAAPNVKLPHFKWLSPGGVLALVVWVVASAGVRVLRGQLWVLQQDLRHARRCSHLLGVALDYQSRRPRRCRVQRRAGAQPRDRSR